MKIYTRTGDQGETGLYGGKRVAKDGLRISAIGDVDELNASLGVASCCEMDDLLKARLLEIQRRLFDLGAELASFPKVPVSVISEADVVWLEHAMDEMSESLPPLRAFVLPGGSPAAAALHFARTVCRRAERAVLALHREEEVRLIARVYLNRLSDWFFIAARTANASHAVLEIEWHAKPESSDEV